VGREFFSISYGSAGEEHPKSIIIIPLDICWFSRRPLNFTVMPCITVVQKIHSFFAQKA
jgi:hypothetical protein